MFGPIYPVPGICRTEEHTIKQNTKRDDENLVAMFAKPIIITRKQEDEALLSGFDNVFIIVFSPSDPAVTQELS